MNRPIYIELLTPRVSSENIERDLEKFRDRCIRVANAGCMAGIPDNPMGNPHFQSLEVLAELDLPFKLDRMTIHLNTFHSRADLDALLEHARELGINSLLAVTGDGGERLHKLTADELGINANTVTSVNLLEYIHKEHPGVFRIGVAYNQYEPREHELEKLRRKVDAGAAFVTTQPVIGRDDRIKGVGELGLPVIIGAWMSPKLHLLSDCVGYPIAEDVPYDPLSNLRELRDLHAECGFYLALLAFKDLPLVGEVLA